MGTLDGKIVLITGTGGGMGRVAALIFAREGAKIIGTDIQAEINAETADLVRRAGGEMTSLAPVDLTDPEQVRLMVEEAVSAYGGLDVVYNNAAVQRFGPMPDFPVEDWRATVAGELDIPFFVSKFTWTHLVRRGGGVIINVASEAGMIAGSTPPMVAHTAANAGVIGMTRQLALEGAPHGIRAVAISPGPVLTPASDRDLGDDQILREAVTSKTLLKRFGRPEEIVELAAFLASDRASFITGANYAVDGGSSAW
ncbi:SDR family NAD(P)-dependent oxidoreductase [Streptomyces sp. NPDC057428]|uniref:SDR family NAD(P)-dependent oxidoreductase n=1 Tax=Streptomyces sp. NPDC057428 TaxID=3346129 RepID=UPI0036B61D61